MRRKPARHTERGFDRLINFTDAVVAIAATLLVLPLITTVSGFTDDPDTTLLLQRDTWWSILWFAVTFWVVTIFWKVHHELFEEIRDYDLGLMILVFAWLAAIVFLTIPAGLQTYAATDNFLGLMYFGAMAVISGLAALMGKYVDQHRELLVNPDKYSWTPAVLLYPALFFAQGLLSKVPGIGDYAPYLGFFLLPVIGSFVARYSHAPPAHTERGFDRVVNFSDAVVAIAITLLVLPLIDLVSDYPDTKSLGEDWQLKLFAFLLTFFVMARYWFIHHGIFERITDYSSGLIVRSFIWLGLMVFLAFPAGLVGEEDAEPGITLMYLATMALITFFAYATDSYAHQHREIIQEDSTKPDKVALINSGYLLALGLLSFVLELSLDIDVYWVLLGIFALPIIVRVRQRQDQPAD